MLTHFPQVRKAGLRPRTFVLLSVLVLVLPFVVVHFGLDRPRRISRSSAERELSRSVYGASLGLKASKRGGGVHITWDRSSEYLRAGASGTLSIVDGPNKTAMPLNSSQLAYGQYFVTPYSQSIEISLEATGPNGAHAAESIAFTPELIAPPAEPPVDPAVPRESARLQPARRQISKRTQRPPLIAQREAERSRTNPNPPVRNASAPAAHVPLNTPSVDALRTLQPLPLPEIRERETPVQSPATATQTASIPSSVREIAKPPMAIAPKPTPATLISRPTVYLPDVLQRAVRNKSVEVSVIAAVDSRGRVKSVSSPESLTGLPEALFLAAKDTVKGWKFEPARVGDATVDSQFTIRLHFGTNQR